MVLKKIFDLFIFSVLFSQILTAQNLTDANLTSAKYWRSKLTDANVTYGYYEKKTKIIVVNKAQKTLHGFEYTGGVLEQTFSQNVITGKSGDKFKEGDLKTPVGVYDIIDKFTPPDPFYGPLAMSLSYPNAHDKAAKKTGGGIWIHGLPMNGKREDEVRTRGCVAFDNDALVKFGKLIGDKGVVIISESEPVDAGKDDIARVLAHLQEWLQMWRDNETKIYLSFYADKFVKIDGKNVLSKAKFAERKKKIFALNEKKSIKASNFSVTPYPSVKGQNLFRVVFDEDYAAPSHEFKGRKELYVQLDKDKFQILTEK